ncbi:MAG: prepilin-type N-terminal cleavage/methylation domain-containing protein [Thiotrichales bacterium]|nr:prepilin-type N-terminal cleavage/methylation domain-containing protein [Thiotrichales bacterium]
MSVAAGFTLIELSIVLFIVGLLLAGLLSPLSQSVGQEQRAVAQSQLEEIKEVLYGFTVANGRLPCPDCRDAIGNCNDAGVVLNDGQEDFQAAGPTLCAASDGTIAQGNLPWVALGTPQFDTWGNMFSYYVDANAADAAPDNTPGCAGVTPLLSSFALCGVSPLNVNNIGRTCAAPATAVATGVTAVVVSHGANTLSQGNGLIQAPGACSELDNFDTFNVAQPYDVNFVSGNYIDPVNNPVTGFDDLVIWITPSILKSKLLSAGLLP